MFSVYFIRSGDVGRPIKIGYTENIEKRMSVIQTSSPDEIHLIGLIPVDSKLQAQNIEKWMHWRFSKNHIRGEWFYGNIRLKKAINEHELSKHGVNWQRVKSVNSDRFWALDNYGIDIRKIKRESESLSLVVDS